MGENGCRAEILKAFSNLEIRVHVHVYVCLHQHTLNFILPDFLGGSDNNIYPIINLMTCLFSVQASPHPHPLGLGPTLGGV